VFQGVFTTVKNVVNVTLFSQIGVKSVKSAIHHSLKVFSVKDAVSAFIRIIFGVKNVKSVFCMKKDTLIVETVKIF